MLQRVNTKILTLRDELRPPGVRKLTGPLEGWRVRVGGLCPLIAGILYQIDETEQTVIIVRVRHRRDVYR
ncbi:MAG: type II toxin-antitoxin system RelE/ParE family toxin [Anaerolineae bacterium]